MRTFKKITKSYQVKIIDSLICDLCGVKAEKPESKQWTGGTFTVSETTISLREGEIYPEGDFVDCTVVDICPECFKHKLLPWVRSQKKNEGGRK